MTRSARGALVFGLAVAALGGVAALNIGALVRFAMAPGVPFDAEPPPPPPDYADPRSWSALPERDDAGDAAPMGRPAVDQRRATVDAFYVHPTPTWDPVGHVSHDGQPLRARRRHERRLHLREQALGGLAPRALAAAPAEAAHASPWWASRSYVWPVVPRRTSRASPTWRVAASCELKV